MHGLVLLALCTLFSTAASVFLKLASHRASAEFSVFDLAGNGLVWFGAFAYFLAFVGYFYALRTIPLSLVQPTITAGASVLTALLAVWFFKESMSIQNWSGLLLVCTGIFLLFFGRV